MTEETKNPVGRPPLWNSAKELQTRIDGYFAYADDSKRPYTLSSLAYFLECDTDTLRNYAAKDEFFGTIKRAKQRIEASKAEKLESKDYSTAGLIFDMINNHGMKQKLETDHTSSDGSMTPRAADSEVVKNAVIDAIKSSHASTNT